MDTGLPQLLHACKANCGYPSASETTTETNGALFKFLGEALMDSVRGWRRKDKEREQKRASWSPLPATGHANMASRAPVFAGV